MRVQLFHRQPDPDLVLRNQRRQMRDAAPHNRVARSPVDLHPQHPRLLQLRPSPLVAVNDTRAYPVRRNPGSIPKISMSTSVAPADRNATVPAQFNSLQLPQKCPRFFRAFSLLE